MRLNELDSCFDNVTPTLEQKQRMLNTVLEQKTNYGGIVTMKRRNKKLITAVAAAVVLVLTATTVLAVSLGWHERFVEYFGIGEEQAMLLEGAVGSPEISVTENGVTINVLNTLTDSRGVYVVFEVIVPNRIELTDDISFDGFYFEADTEHREGIGGAVSGGDILNVNTNKITALAYYLPTEPIADGTLRLFLEDIGYGVWVKDAGYEFTTLIAGEWSLEWDFSYTDTAKKITPDQEVQIGIDGTGLITEISISPISLVVVTQLQISNPHDLDALTIIEDYTVTFKNGSTSILGLSRARSTDSSSNMLKEGMIYEHRVYSRFDYIIDPEDIVSVTIGDVTIPLG